MKVIIAGGRDYQFTDEDVAWLDSLHQDKKFTEVVSGGARGADTCGESWAASNGVPIKKFLPDWSKGRSAGPLRNRQMADYLRSGGGGLVVLFPGGMGTRSMESIARASGLPVIKRVEGLDGVVASCGGRLWGR